MVGLVAPRTRAADQTRTGWALLHPAHWDLTDISRAGLAATVSIAIGSFGAGALPANDPTRHIPVIGLLRSGWVGLHVALALYYLGLLLLIATWLVLGRHLLTASRSGDAPAPAALRRMFVRWMLPLLVGMPLASSDLYSYAAQAQLARIGRDPYTFTPADLPGKFLDNVAWKWVDTPSPYGPLWVSVSRWMAAITGDHALLTVMVLRLIPFAAVVATAFMLPRLAQRFGGRGDLALWVAIGNPLVLLHSVAGGHNDAVMVCLMVAALTAASSPRADLRHLAAGAALAALAAAVKAPGAIAVAFVVPVYMLARTRVAERISDGTSTPDSPQSTQSAGVATWIRSCLFAAIAAGAIFAAITWLVGYGNGWIKQISPAVPVINFMSIPTMLAVAYRAILGAAHAGTLVDSTVRGFRRGGTVVCTILLIWFWLRSTRGSAVFYLTISLAAVVVLSPAVQPWYFTWALTTATLIALRTSVVWWIAVASIALTLLTRPMGSSLQIAAYIPVVIAACVATRALLGPTVARTAETESASTPS